MTERNISKMSVLTHVFEVELETAAPSLAEEHKRIKESTRPEYLVGMTKDAINYYYQQGAGTESLEELWRKAKLITTAISQKNR